MNDLPIHIMSDGIELSFLLRKFIEKKISALSRFSADILSTQLVLREKSGAKGLLSVKARLALPGRDIHGNAAHENFYAAINQLVTRLARLSRKRKTRYKKRVRRGRKLHSPDRIPTPNLRKQRRMRHIEKLSERSIMSLSPHVAQT